jgi:DNA-directed RNA polymerase specialized sigma24 family protein
MTRSHGPTHDLIAWANSPAASRLALSATHPLLTAHRSIGELVHAGWADADLAGRLLVALMAHADSEPVATEAALAILAPRLAVVIARWIRAGVAADDLDDMEADLVVETLALLKSGAGPRPPAAIADRAWDRTRKSRRRHRTHQSALGHLDEVATNPTPDRAPAAVTAAAIVIDNYRNGRLSLPAAQALWATGVAGCSCVEAADRLGCAPTAVRARRSRALRALAA